MLIWLPLLVSTQAAGEDTVFRYEIKGASETVVEGTGGGFYTMAGRFHITLIHSHEQGDMTVLDFFTKESVPLDPGQYSIGMFGQVNAGLEHRSGGAFWEFDATGGRLIIHSSEAGRISGEFDLKATDMDNGDDIEVKGTFEAGSTGNQND